MNKKVLIIEDETELADIIRDYLKKDNFEVIICNSGNEALTIFNKVQPDIILLDLMLPGIDGLEILRNIRLQSTLPVIIISAKETELDRILGLGLGADDYVVKPFSIKELVARVKAQLRRATTFTNLQTDEKSVLKFCDIQVNRISRVVKKSGVEIQFTAKEFDILSFLLSHPNQVFSKQHLYDQVWGFDEYGDLNTVVIHIQKIRDKLALANCIVTVRSVGYRFNGDLL
ncbi:MULTISPECIES: response regulator transcription factor [Sporosarcina]|uniref:DNA-binding response OmpR family regulator n=1 Tax=Sporosarcina psychrophila TaxID=1476 RepID=A0ABV2K1H7_SPOPS|nr:MULTISPECIES: response regulator transcription factor [Sporosarcina]AMQ08291.1 DNA-binding response regulator [Sporosarcina psychrophila]QNK88091.1 response regulator transcription factor [Sporosarcina sp. resist]